MKAILLCLGLATVSTVLGMGTRHHVNPDKLYGKGPEFEQKVRDQHDGLRAEKGMGAPQEFTFDQRIDHFNNSDTRTYKMRYLLQNETYNVDSGPILFYAGNEGGVYAFYNNTGFQTEYLASKFKATVVFAEHRFYGKSMPFGDKSFDKESGNLRYLNVEQVMADYVALLTKLKSDIPSLKNKATILFGGSYGGMLAAWIRMKYPHIFQGALASSAPVLWFKGKIVNTAYDTIASKVIKQQGGQ
jgi:lysosomal Pro-X carboxypeptidase